LIAACGDFTSGTDPAANDAHPPGAIDGGGEATEASALAGGIKVSLVDEGFIVQGSSSAVRIKVERTGSFAGPVNLSFSGLPPNVAAMAGAAAPSDVEASVVVTVPASLAQGKLTATLDATSADGTIAVSQAVSLYVRGKPGTLDPTFGQGGAVDIADPALYVQPTGIGVDAGGRVVVSLADGHSNVLRLTPAGLPDGSFGMNGVAHVDDVNQNVAAIAISDQGRVVVVYAVASGSRIVRLTSTGGLDTSFGVMGETLPAYPGIASHQPRRCALLPDERLLLAEAAGTNWLVALFDVKGALEPTFGGSGYVTQSWPPPGASSPSSEISTLTLEPGGGIFLAGAAHYGPSGARADEMALTELSTTGSPVQGALGWSLCARRRFRVHGRRSPREERRHEGFHIRDGRGRRPHAFSGLQCRRSSLRGRRLVRTYCRERRRSPSTKVRCQGRRRRRVCSGGVADSARARSQLHC
jgi:hypothetical protein